ncbi:MAG: hypothetical protein J6V72_07615, partial [Kiritimatiellae bacterium]|nr:hypothetical protein [Kiritimatiellia bacterium]
MKVPGSHQIISIVAPPGSVMVFVAPLIRGTTISAFPLAAPLGLATAVGATVVGAAATGAAAVGAAAVGAAATGAAATGAAAV